MHEGERQLDSLAEALLSAVRAGGGCVVLVLLRLAQLLGVLMMVQVAFEAFVGNGWLVGLALKGAGTFAAATVAHAWWFGRGKEAGEPSFVERREQLRERYPDEPWRWYDEWASGRLRSAEAGKALLFGFAALFWNVFIWISIGATWRQGVAEVRAGEYGWLVFGLFAIAGLMLAGMALRHLFVWWRFGTTVFVMDSVPGVIGGRIRGTILTRLRKRPPSLTLELECSRTEVTRGASRRDSRGRRVDETTSTTTELWSVSREVNGERLTPTTEGFALRVSFAIPYDCRPTDSSNRDDRVSWRLSLATDLPGIDLCADWMVPIFVTSESKPLAADEREEDREQELEGFDARGSEPIGWFEPVRIRATGSGGTHYTLRIETTLGQVASSGAIAIAALVALGMGLSLDWPLGVKLTTAGILALYVVGIAILLGWRGHVLVEEDRAEVSLRLFGLPLSREIVPFAEITGVQVVQEGTSRKRRWSVRIDRAQGPPLDAGCQLASYRQALWLASEIERSAARSEP